MNGLFEIIINIEIYTSLIFPLLIFIIKMLYDHLFKIVIIGDKGAGKSCLLTQYINKNFTDSNIGINFDFKEFIIDNKKIKAQFWTIKDYSGEESKLNSPYNGFIIIYDVTNKKSFKFIENKIKIINHYYENIPIIIVGNKIDEKNRNITTEEVNEFSKKNNIMNIEVSIKHNINIDLIFEKLLKKILEKNSKSIKHYKCFKYSIYILFIMFILFIMVILLFNLVF
jgi:small GTP-binding protein